MKEIHKHVIGIDKLIKNNPLYKCGSCLPARMYKTPHKRTAKYKDRKNNKTQTMRIPIEPPAMDDPYNDNDDELPTGVASQHFHMGKIIPEYAKL